VLDVELALKEFDRITEWRCGKGTRAHEDARSTSYSSYPSA
jgi:hypothetical protein